MSAPRCLRTLAGNERGATALLTGLSLIVVLGFVGFAIDAGSGYAARRTAQSAADSAAYSAALASSGGASAAADEARAIAAQYGLKAGKGGVAVTANTPPTSGGYAGAKDAAEVIVSRPAPQFFSGLFIKGPMTVRARAVAAKRMTQKGDGCILALNQTDPMSLLLNGTPVVNLSGCSVWVNSSSAQALSLNGGAIINATQANVHGGAYQSGSAQLNAQLNTNAPVQTDPYADVGLPSYSGCDSGGAGGGTTVNSNTATIFAPKIAGGTYVFCNGLQVNSGANVTFKPGVYVVDAGSLIFNGQSIIRGAGVTFVLTNHTGSNIATLIVNGGADIDLAAPSSGAYSGLMFYEDRRAAPGGQDTLNGGARQILKGTLYFPRRMLVFNGGTDVHAGGCTQILADKVTFNGNARLAADCGGAGVRPIASMQIALVE